MPTPAADLRQNPHKAAKNAQLRYVSNEESGYTRIKKGRGFSYQDHDKQVVKDKALKKRFESLVIPPNWKDVWICRDKKGHIQATGRDDKGRKQYIYHEDWLALRDQAKFDVLLPFAERLPKLRAQVKKDLQKDCLSKEHVTAAMIRLLELSLIRVGNDSYAKENKTYGLTTLRTKHVEVKGKTLEMSFIGKSGKEHHINVEDKELAKVVKACSELPGYRVFQYLDENGEKQTIDSSDINAYLKQHMDEAFSAKDFRTWAASVMAASMLSEVDSETLNDEKAREKELLDVIKQVAKELGNTPAVCRDAYIHPTVQQTFLENNLRKRLDKSKVRYKSSYLSKDEKQLLNFLAA